MIPDELLRSLDIKNMSAYLNILKDCLHMQKDDSLTDFESCLAEKEELSLQSHRMSLQSFTELSWCKHQSAVDLYVLNLLQDYLHEVLQK